MRLVRFGPKNNEKPGILDTDENIRDVSALVDDWTGATLNDAQFEKLRGTDLNTLPIIDKSVRLGAPVSGVGKIVGCALTYAAHAAEADEETPTDPMIMLISSTAINGPYDDVIIPRGGTKLDWEAELGVVIGKGGNYIPVEEAMMHVAGFCTGNDLSERVFQLERGTQWTKGKSADTLKPLGPWLVTRDEIENPNDLDISMTVSGETMQSANTSDMSFSIAQLVSRISEYLTWQAGDVMLTGTPPGVGYGMKPQRYLKPGEYVSSSIEKLGTQKNMIRAYHESQ